AIPHIGLTSHEPWIESRIEVCSPAMRYRWAPVTPGPLSPSAFGIAERSGASCCRKKAAASATPLDRSGATALPPEPALVRGTQMAYGDTAAVCRPGSVTTPRLRKFAPPLTGNLSNAPRFCTVASPEKDEKSAFAPLSPESLPASSTSVPLLVGATN